METLNGLELYENPVNCSVGNMNPNYSQNLTWFCRLTRNREVLSANGIDLKAVEQLEDEAFIEAGKIDEEEEEEDLETEDPDAEDDTDTDVDEDTDPDPDTDKDTDTDTDTDTVTDPETDVDEITDTTDETNG